MPPVHHQVRSLHCVWSFGGHGAHYCIGANLARMEVNLMFNAIADSGVRFHLEAEPERLRSGWLNGVKRMHMSYEKPGA